MKRFFVLAGLVAAPPVYAQNAQQPAAPVVLVQQVQLGVVEQQVSPGTQPKPREDVKVDPKTDPNPKSLEVPPAQLLRSRELVRQLGSPVYRDREAATRELLKMGRAAVLALSEARTTETSPEIRYRAELCLPAAEADDMRAKVNCFLADVDAKYEHSLPGWNKFRNVVGNDKAARELFAEVLKKRDMHQLLMAAELQPNELSQVLNNHYREIQTRANLGQWNGGRGGIYQAQQAPTTAEIVVLAFLESVYSDKEVQVNYNYGQSITNYLYQQDIQNAMGSQRTGKYAVPIRKVLIRWLDTRETSQGAQMAMQFAQNWGMSDDIPRYASRVLAGETLGNPWIKTNALNVLAQHKNARQYLDTIAKVFDDSSIIQQAIPGRGNQHNITLGDYALGIAISITGQNHKEYGMDVLNNQYKWNQNNYFFLDDDKNKAEDKRKTAIKKWDDWSKKEKEKQPVKDAPKSTTPKPDTPKSDVPNSDAPVKHGIIEQAIPTPVKAPPIQDR